MNQSFARAYALARGHNNTMDDDAILRIILPIKINIKDITEGTASAKQAYECYEFFVISYGAGINALERIDPSSHELILDRCKSLTSAANLARSLYTTLRTNQTHSTTAATSEVLDSGLTAGKELHYTLPEWAFMSSTLELSKIGKRPKPKKKRRK